MLVLSIIAYVHASVFYIKSRDTEKYFGIADIGQNMRMVTDKSAADKFRLLFFAPITFFKIEQFGFSRLYLTNSRNRLTLSRLISDTNTGAEVQTNSRTNAQIFEMVMHSNSSRIFSIKQNDLCVTERETYLYLEPCNNENRNQFFEFSITNDRILNDRVNTETGPRAGEHLFIPDNQDLTPINRPYQRLFFPSTRPKDPETIKRDMAIHDLKQETIDLRTKNDDQGRIQQEIEGSDRDADISLLLNDLRKYIPLRDPSVNPTDKIPGENETQGTRNPVYNLRPNRPSITDDSVGVDDGRMSTSLPPASLPSTSLPSASLPSASSPYTSLPPTSLPSTSLPSTSLPSTSLPSTSSPSTSLPSSSVPRSDDVDNFARSLGNYMERFGDNMCELVFNVGLKFLRYAKNQLKAKRVTKMGFDDFLDDRDTNKESARQRDILN